LDKVQDTNGNYMTITYWKDQGEIYLDRIDYTGNASLSPTNYVKFYLESRNDKPPMYTTNALVETAYRLKTIEVVANGQLVRKYVLNYSGSNSTYRSLLTSLTLYGSDGVTSLPAMTFGYQDGGIGFNGYTQWGYNGADIWDRYKLGDFNGDGKTDVISFESNGGLYVWLSNGSSFNGAAQWGSNVSDIGPGRYKLGDFIGNGK
jgi:hypothetical protein